MRGIFTREERAVVLFLTVSLLVGSAIVGAGRVLPWEVPDFSGRALQASESIGSEPDGPVNVNTAGIEELDRLPGIGPARARELVRVRDRLGGFTSLDQLLEVRGIGPVTLAKLRESATLGSGTDPAAASASDPAAECETAAADSAPPGTSGTRAEPVVQRQP